MPCEAAEVGAGNDSEVETNEGFGDTDKEPGDISTKI